MRFLKTVGLTLCAVSLSAFVVASANAQDKPMMKKHHHHHGYHHHHVTKGKGGGRH
jgi:Spy/CpxP family protein refolding chaperone